MFSKNKHHYEATRKVSVNIQRHVVFMIWRQQKVRTIVPSVKYQLLLYKNSPYKVLTWLGYQS